MRVLIAAAALCLAGTAAAQNEAVGTGSGEFLQLGAGARASAMGEAYSAVADDPSAVYWNPAALTRVASKSVTLMHSTYIDSSRFSFGAYAHPLGRAGAFGISLTHFTWGELSQTSEFGDETGRFTPSDLAVSAGYGYTLRNAEFSALEGLAIGVAGKFIRSQIVHSAQTGAIDIGLLSRAYARDRLRVAVTATNLGGRLRYATRSEPLPTELRAGAAAALGARWLVSADAVAPSAGSAYANAGFEYKLAASGPWGMAARAGLNSQRLLDLDGLGGASFGIGVSGARIAVDYAMLPLGELGLSHRAGVTLRF